MYSVYVWITGSLGDSLGSRSSYFVLDIHWYYSGSDFVVGTHGLGELGQLVVLGLVVAVQRGG